MSLPTVPDIRPFRMSTMILSVAGLILSLLLTYLPLAKPKPIIEDVLMTLFKSNSSHLWPLPAGHRGLGYFFIIISSKRQKANLRNFTHFSLIAVAEHPWWNKVALLFIWMSCRLCVSIVKQWEDLITSFSVRWVIFLKRLLLLAYFQSGQQSLHRDVWLIFHQGFQHMVLCQRILDKSTEAGATPGMKITVCDSHVRMHPFWHKDNQCLRNTGCKSLEGRSLALIRRTHL